MDDITVDGMQTIVSNALPEDKGDLIMSLADKIRKEGLEQGLEQGREQGLEQGLLEGVELAVSIKFGDTEDSRTAIEKIKKIKNIELLKALKDNIKTAEKPSDLIRIIEN